MGATVKILDSKTHKILYELELFDKDKYYILLDKNTNYKIVEVKAEWWMEDFKLDYQKLMSTLDEIYEASNQDLSQENANTNGSSPTGKMSLVSGVASKEYARKFLDDDVLEAFDKGYIHCHDFDYFATKTLTCCQIPLGKLLKNGFKIGGCFIREPQSIETAVQLMAIILQSNQNMQHR